VQNAVDVDQIRPEFLAADRSVHSTVDINHLH
jgi:hypothetical protein